MSELMLRRATVGHGDRIPCATESKQHGGSIQLGRRTFGELNAKVNQFSPECF